MDKIEVQRVIGDPERQKEVVDLHETAAPQPPQPNLGK